MISLTRNKAPEAADAAQLFHPPGSNTSVTTHLCLRSMGIASGARWRRKSILPLQHRRTAGGNRRQWSENVSTTFHAIGPLATPGRPGNRAPDHPALGGGIFADSVVVGGRGGTLYGVRYQIRCDTEWRVLAFSVETTSGKRLALTSADPGNWQTESGKHLPDLQGCIDIDLAGSPFTNTLPIRRLGLTPSAGTAKLQMLYVPFDSFEPVRDGQHYTCLEEGRLYRYQAEDRSFAADLPVDEDGIVLDYPTLFERLKAKR